VEDLEQDASPEDIMLSYVSGDKSKVRKASIICLLFPPSISRRELREKERERGGKNQTHNASACS
jgi:hypothetical protein